jgi:biotin transport system substrate-specific component
MKFSIRDICIIGIFVALTAAMAQITIPIPVVPLTLQTLAVPLAGAVLGAKKGAIAIAVYVLLGGLGVPVFATFTGGPVIITGATGGFLLAFPLYALIVGFAADKERHKRAWLAGGLIAGAVVLFALGGIVWPLLRGFAPTVGVAFTLWVLPFLLADLIKIVMVFVIAPELQKVMKKVMYSAV